MSFGNWPVGVHRKETEIMPEKRVTIRRVKTSDLIAMWTVYHDATKDYSPGSVAFGPGCLPPSPEVKNIQAVSLRCARLSLRCPELHRMPTWRRRIVGWIYAKRPITFSVGPESESFFAAR
jgi:hypothetical protein